MSLQNYVVILFRQRRVSGHSENQSFVLNLQLMLAYRYFNDIWTGQVRIGVTLDQRSPIVKVP